MPAPVREARGVVERTFGTFPDNVRFKVMEAEMPAYAISVSRGVLTVEGTSPVAICKGFHDYILAHGYGVNTWSGSRLDLPGDLPDEKRVVTESPYEHHLFFNVCTFGYTMPFWGWNEWEKMLDWLALHGFDMPLSPTGSDAIMARTWSKMGLSDEEIAWYFTSPVHFPWMRMGNMSHSEGPLSKDWMESQVALEHQILAREKALGMTPVFQGFAGFVPPAYEQHFGTKLTRTDWRHYREEDCNFMLSPEDSMFAVTGTEYIKEWEKEFGKGEFYLIDSFNEMAVPFEDKEAMLSRYGEVIYSSLAAANPDAVWVMQGWMLGYQRDIWNYDALAALGSKVPENKLMVIDLGVDFNKYIWKNSFNWDHFKGFADMPWIWSTVPNFGGRNAVLGQLEFYLNGHLEALSSPNKGKLKGFGTSPEGLENNEILYEIISAAGWKSGRTDLMDFLSNYTAARYGCGRETFEQFWRELLKSSYGVFSQERSYLWQRVPPRRKPSELNTNEHYDEAIRCFMQADPEDKTLYEDDVLMYAALYLGSKGEEAMEKMYACFDEGRLEDGAEYADLCCEILLQADRLLESHSLYRVQRWIDLARASGTSEPEKDKFELDAKRLISTWGGTGLDDYAGRVWSGLLRDYYVPRIHYYVDCRKAGMTDEEIRKTPDITPDNLYPQDIIKAKMRTGFPVTPGLSPCEPFDDPIAMAKELVEKYQ